MANKATRARQRAATKPVRETPRASAAPVVDVAAIDAPGAAAAVPAASPAADVKVDDAGKYASGENLKLGLMHDGNKFLVGDWQDKTRRKFRQLVANTPELRELAGERGASTAVPIDDLPDEAIGAIFGAIGAVGRWALARSGKLSPEQLVAVGYTNEQVKALTPLAKRVIAKRLPSGALEYSDEIALVMAMMEMLRSNIERATPAERRGPAHVVQHPSADTSSQQA